MWPEACHPRESAGPGPAAAAFQTSCVQRLVKVLPIRIEPLDQLELPLSLPFLHLLFPVDRLPDVAVVLAPDQRLDGISRGEAGACAIAMLKGPRGEMVFGHAHIESPLRRLAMA